MLDPERKRPDTRPTYDELGGLEAEIERLKRVGMILNDPLAAEYGVHPPSGIVLSGPSGVGKTALAKAFSREIGAELVEIGTSDIHGKYYGDSSAQLRSQFDKAANMSGRVVLLFDEFDGLFGTAAGGNPGVTLSLAAELKKCMSNLQQRQPNTIVAATIEKIGDVNPALLRAGRFDLVMPLGLPDTQARASIFGSHIAKLATHYMVKGPKGVDSEGIDFMKLAVRTQGMTGADIEAILHAARQKNYAAGRATRSMPLPVTHRDVVHAIDQHRQDRAK